MVDFPQPVSGPSGASYSAPILSFDQFANLPNRYYQGVFNQQQQGLNNQQSQINDQRIAQMQRQANLTQAFPNGLPIDPNTGQINYAQVAATLAKFGDPQDAISLLQSQPPPMSPLLGGAASAAPAQAGGPAPDSVPARPLPAPARNAPQGDSGQNTVTSIVTDRLPSQNQTTGQTISKIAGLMGVDPNADLTPGQVRRAQGLLQRYAPDMTGVKVAGDQSSALPPSINAGTPAVTPRVQVADASAAPASFADRFAAAKAGAPQPQAQPQARPQVQPQAQPAPAPQQAPQGPIVPPVPLPPGFSDPQKAILALRTEAARVGQNPRGAAQARELDDWANRIEQSLKPIPIRAGETLIDPRSGRVIVQGQSTNANNIALQRFLEAKPDATPEEIQSFIQSGRAVRSAPAMAVQAFQRDFEKQNGRAPSAEEVTQFAMDYSRQQSYGRAAGTQGARVENAANEVVQLIPQAIEASKTVPRNKWVPINKLVQAWDQGTSDPAYNDFLMANFSLLNAYTRAMNPQGVPRIQERLEQHALGVLSTATDEKAYEVQVRRLWKEVQASKVATAETAKGVTPGNINAPVPGLDTTKQSQQNVTSGGLKWSVEP